MSLSLPVLKSGDIKKILRMRRIILLMVVFAFCLFDVAPKVWRMQILREQIAIAERDIVPVSPAERMKQVDQLKSDLEQLSAQVKQLEREAGAVQAKIRPERNIAVVTLDIEDLATTTKVAITSLKPLEEIPASRYVILPLEVGVRSAFPPFLDFLSKLETAATVMAVDSVSIHKPSSDDEMLDMSLRLYLLFPKATIAVVGSDEKGTAQ